MQEKCLTGAFADAEATIGAEGDKPEDDTVGIGDDELALALNGGKLAVGKEVANEFCATHAERLETVALMDRTQREGK